MLTSRGKLQRRKRNKTSVANDSKLTCHFSLHTLGVDPVLQLLGESGDCPYNGALLDVVYIIDFQGDVFPT